MQAVRKEYQGHYYHVATTGNLILGFTETGFPVELFPQLFSGAGVKTLKQVHGSTIILSSQIDPDSQGDGIILDEPDTLAIIKTADCAPLFFWDKTFSTGGVIHIGWRGFLKGIQHNLIDILEKKGFRGEQMRFYIGPAIEGSCYQVGQDLYKKFINHSHRPHIFTPSISGKFFLDLPLAISMDLMDRGVGEQQITSCHICTSCQSGYFPSYRKKGKTGERILNFITFLK
jgi:YfiH family protein